MTSIRKHLLGWLLVGLGILWLAGGIAVYFTVRSSLVGKFDAELNAIASEVRYLLPEGGLPGDDGANSPHAFEFFETDSGLYFQVWDSDLLFSDRSPNLKGQSLPKPGAFKKTPVMWDVNLTAHEHVRIMAQQFELFPGGGDPAVINVVVARSRDSLDRSIQLLLMSLGLAGILLIPMSFIIVRVAVGHGLKPLRELTDKVASIRIDALHERFEFSAIPEELRPICKRLNELMVRLEEGLERERRLNADLAHELRTPITELKLMAEVAMNWPDKINADEYGDVLRVANKMQDVIESMLLLARLERGATHPEKTAVNIDEAIENCWQGHRQSAQAKNISVRREISPDATMHTNPELFQILFTNLMSNAVAYSPDGSTIEITSGGHNGNVELSISNRAENLDRADIPHLFDRFWRQDRARSNSGHAGLGLSLAQACAGVLSLNLSATFEESPKTIVFVLSKDDSNGPAD